MVVFFGIVESKLFIPLRTTEGFSITGGDTTIGGAGSGFVSVEATGESDGPKVTTGIVW